MLGDVVVRHPPAWIRDVEQEMICVHLVDEPAASPTRKVQSIWAVAVTSITEGREPNA